jgi:hypothetical protein
LLPPPADGIGDGIADDESSSENTPTSLEARTMCTSLKTLGESWLIPRRIPGSQLGLVKRLTRVRRPQSVEWGRDRRSPRLYRSAAVYLYVPNFDFLPERASDRWWKYCLLRNTGFFLLNVSDPSTSQVCASHPFCKLAMDESMNW